MKESCVNPLLSRMNRASGSEGVWGSKGRKEHEVRW